MILRPLEEKVIFERAKLGYNKHFLSNSFNSSVSRSLRKQLFKKAKCHIGGGGQKSAKKCHVLFE